MMQQSADGQFARIAAAAQKLRPRGARIVWVRPPSHGGVRELERKFTPREAFWAGRLTASESPGIHYADHPELAGFDCPEWSHLTADEAVRFSRALMQHVKAALAGQGNPRGS